MHALRTKTARLATSAVLTLGAVGAFLAVGTAPASATVRPAIASCYHSNQLGICPQIDYPTTLWSASNTSEGTLGAGTTIEVTCWYPGNTNDGEWDHVVWTSSKGSINGHVDDDYVGLGGKEASYYVGRC